MNKTKALLLGVLSAFSQSCAVTPVQLNADKEVYHGQHVLVRGWMRSGFENYGLWLDKAAEARGKFASDCVSLMIPETIDSSRFDQRYVEVEGVFLKRYPKNVFVSGGCNLSALELLETAPPRIVRAGSD